MTDNITEANFKEFIGEVEKFFKEKYRLESLKVVKDRFLKEPSYAAVKALERVYAEMNPKLFPTIEKITLLVEEEGRKYRMKQAKDREDEWDKEKGVDKYGRVSGQTVLTKEQHTEYSKRCAMGLKLMLSDAPKEMKLQHFRVMEECYPGCDWAKEGARLKKDYETL